LEELLILKVGGSVITDKGRPLAIDREAMEAVCGEISRAYVDGVRRIVVIHGGGSYGHYIVSRIRESKGSIDLHGFSEVAWWMGELNREFVAMLRSMSVPAVSIPTHAIFHEEAGRFVGYIDLVRYMVYRDLVPVLYGDAVISKEGGFSILSGDIIAWILARELGSKKVLFATNVDGVFNRDPSAPGAILLRELRVSRDMVDLGGSSGYDVTGGMRRKIMEGIDAMRMGVRAIIFNGRRRGNLYKALTGSEDVGTVVLY
jgi:isopentenyl phosphate kinase